MKKQDSTENRLDALVAKAKREQAERELSYRERALNMYPWICGRCTREFTRKNLQELTVHHRDHNHDNNPADGSNWELLCLYCHDNEHSRYIDNAGASAVAGKKTDSASFKAFDGLKDLLKKKADD